ncbi:hypothetical protein KBA63_00715 [Candidatus Woesebacteria bacterium]|nr:hypothetical protein [Candidatus Woesebacteria bacterium]
MKTKVTIELDERQAELCEFFCKASGKSLENIVELTFVCGLNEISKDIMARIKTDDKV